MISNNKEKNFIKGAMILAVAGVIVKGLGAAFRIPITNKIGSGMAYYNVAYTIYSVFLVLATAGIPVAVSRLVAEKKATGHHKAAHKVFTVSLVLLGSIGLCTSLICFFGADKFSTLIKIPEAKMSLKAISPAICIVPVMSAFRGYFQGMQNMKPTAVSELVEQLFRVIIGLVLTFSLFSYGLQASAAGATFGASAGSIMGLVIILLIYKCNKKKIIRDIESGKMECENTRLILKKIACISIPIICGAEIMPLMSMIDTSIIVARLEATGWTHQAATDMYSQYGAYCSTLIGLPQIFTQAVSVSLVPALATAFQRNRTKDVEEKICSGMRLSMIMSFPCAVGMFSLAKPILLTLYPYQEEDALSAVPLLMIMTVGIVLLSAVQTLTGALQAIDKQIVPVKNLAIGAVAKGIVTYILVSIPFISIKGAAIGTICAYLIAFVLNLKAIRKYTNVQFHIIKIYVKPFIASAIMGISTFIVQYALSISLSNSFSTIIAIAFGIIIYFFIIIRNEILPKEDVELIPGGKFLLKINKIKS